MSCMFICLHVSPFCFLCCGVDIIHLAGTVTGWRSWFCRWAEYISTWF
uniref:Uncharacterized protein n=1 Tax=Rhizophora mucronata TaxID=61149 RepID=A0A2P2R3U9_RHIMU